MPPPPAQVPKKKFATLGDVRGSGGPGRAGHDEDDDDDNDEDFKPDDDNQNLYAGGEKSGLAVENPDDLKKKILERAKKCVLHRASNPRTHLLTILSFQEMSQDQVETTLVLPPLASQEQLEL